MKKNAVIPAVIGAAMFLLTNSLFAQYPDTAKIMTYNINAETHTDGDYADIGDVIKAINPAIAGLQKVDSFTVTAAPVYVLKALGEQTSMFYTFSMSYAKNNGSYGNGFLSDSVPNSTRHLAIPKGNASEDRSALEIGITMAGEKVRVIVTHLDYGAVANRTAQLQQILSWIDSGGKAADPVVIMADFNAQSNESSMTVLTDAGFVYVKGSNGVVLDTAQKINHILYRPENRWSILSVGNPAYAASNRYPLWANMKLLNPVQAVAPSPEAPKNAMRGRVAIAGGRVELQVVEASRVSLELFDFSGGKIGALMQEGMLCAGKHAFSLPKGFSARGMAVLAARINGSMLTKKVVLSH
jgi:endonuclease/exonuclease/phosphatase family metal-dependent hydrolase